MSEGNQPKPLTAEFALKPSYVYELVYTLVPCGFKSAESGSSPLSIL